MTAQWISIASADERTYEGYLSLPPRGAGPGIVLFQEIFGVNRHIRAVADQYALDGFVVLAPDVFWRAAPRVELGYEDRDRDRGRQLAQQLSSVTLIDDIQNSIAALRDRPEVTGKIGTLGYCMGGRLAYLAAATADVAAAACFYGGGIQDHLDRAQSVSCPVQFHYGARDAHIPLAAVDAVRAAFAGKAAEVYVYDGAEHGFNCWERATYDPRSAALAHARTLAFFVQHLF